MSALVEVAEHLSDQARKESGARRDAFGRSAFNRYYYASFLSVRELLVEIDSSWSTTPHANFPSLLQDALVKQVRREAKKQERAGIISPGSASSLITQAASATSEIASVLRVANAARVAADYEPEITVEFDANGFRLDGKTDATARGWKGRVDRMKGVLLHVCKELAIV
jgi:hypothetical protein